jgi:hypothetical protein
MDDAVPVGFVESVGDLGNDRDGSSQRQRALVLNYGRQVRPFDQLLDDVQLILPLPGVVDGDDIRVIEQRREAVFTLEPRAEDEVQAVLGGKQLERDVTVKTLVVCALDGRHRATADDPRHAVAPDKVADRGHSLTTCSPRGRAAP